MADLQTLLKQFEQEDMLRRTGQGGDQANAGLRDRQNEGALIAGLLGPAAPLATVPVGIVGAGYEGIKKLGQETGLGKHFPGPFRQGPETSPASLGNVLSLMKGYTTQAQEPYKNFLSSVLGE